MLKARLCIAAVFAMCVVGGAMASSASAAFVLTEKACEPGHWAFCWEASLAGVGLQELTGEEEVTLTQVAGVEALLEAKFGESIVHIECTSTSAVNGVVHQADPLKEPPFATGAIDFNTCTLLPPLSEKCTIPALIETKALLAQNVSPEGETKPEVEFKPAEGEIFTEITFSGEKCPTIIKGKQPVKGSQICIWEKPEVDLIDHNLACEESGSKLKLGTNAATFLDLATVLFPKLEETDFWDVVLA